jgi:hypothetical protein
MVLGVVIGSTSITAAEDESDDRSDGFADRCAGSDIGEVVRRLCTRLKATAQMMGTVTIGDGPHPPAAAVAKAAPVAVWLEGNEAVRRLGECGATGVGGGRRTA